jgi:hypothetical protein
MAPKLNHFLVSEDDLIEECNKKLSNMNYRCQFLAWICQQKKDMALLIFEKYLVD